MAQQLTNAGRGSAGSSSASRFARVVARDVRAHLVSRGLVAGAFIAVPLVYGWSQMQRTISRDSLDVYFEFFTSPVILMLPGVAAVLGSSSLFAELGNRFVANTRTRMSAAQYLGAKFVAGGATAFAAFALSAFVAFVVAFWVWPALGNFHVDPASSSMTPRQAHAHAVLRFTFSQLLALSDIAFGLGYSAWFGLCGLVFATASNVLLVVIPSRAAALALPLAFYLAQTVAASLLGLPAAGLIYSAVPFGLAQSPILVGALPTLVLAAATLAGAVAVVAGARGLRRLS